MDLQRVSSWLAVLLVTALLFGGDGWVLPAARAAVGMAQEPEDDSVDGGEGVVDAAPAGSSDRERRLRKRLLTVAVLGGVVLLLLAVVYGYFRLELTTRGFYSGRLQVVSGIASVAVVTAAYFLWRWLIR